MAEENCSLHGSQGAKKERERAHLYNKIHPHKPLSCDSISQSPHDPDSSQRPQL
jgi:hypothetical protein